MAESDIMSSDSGPFADQFVSADIFKNNSIEEIYQIIEDSLRANEVLRGENEMFENYLTRIEQRGDAQAISDSAANQTLSGGGGQLSYAGGGRGGGLAGASGAIEFAGSGVGGSGGAPIAGTQPMQSRKRSKSRSSASEKLMKLTAEQKCEIAQLEIDECKVTSAKLIEESDKILDMYDAIKEEADIHMNEINKFLGEFEREVVKTAKPQASSKKSQLNSVSAEKFNRFVEEKIRQRDTLVDKLRLKNTTLKQSQKKLKVQLKQKEEMGEVLLEVDFQQLRIENSQYLEKIDEKNQELLKLKLMSGKTLQVLNQYKKKMNTLLDESKRVKNDIQTRQDLIKKNLIEIDQVEEERLKAESTNNRLKDYLSDYRVPEVMDYVQCVAEGYELNKKEKILNRKVNIAKMALNKHKNIWNQIRKGTPIQN